LGVGDQVLAAAAAGQGVLQGRFPPAPAAPAQGPAQPRSHGRAPRGKPGGEISLENT